MRVVFMGTPQIAADCLSRLIADGFDLVGVYTKPDMPKNRGMKLAMSEVKEVALAAGLGIWATGEEKLPTVTFVYVYNVDSENPLDFTSISNDSLAVTMKIAFDDKGNLAPEYELVKTTPAEE